MSKDTGVVHYSFWWLGFIPFLIVVSKILPRSLPYESYASNSSFVRLINDLHLLWADPAVSVFLLLLAVLSVFIMFVIKFKCYTFDDKRLSFKRGLFKKREYVDWSDIRKMVIKDGGFYGSVIVEIDVEDKEIWLRNELKGAGKRFYELLEEHTPKDAFEKIRYVVHKTEGGILWKAPK